MNSAASALASTSRRHAIPRSICAKCGAIRAPSKRDFSSTQSALGNQQKPATGRAAAAAIDLDVGNGLAEALKTYAESRDNGLRVTSAAYRDLLTKAAHHMSNYAGHTRSKPPHGIGWHVMLAVCKDAANGGYEASRTFPSILPAIRLEMLQQTRLTPTILQQTALPAIVEENLEHMILICYQMFQLQMPPGTDLLTTLVRVACENGQPRLALQVIQRSEDLAGQIYTKDWYTVLLSSAKNRYLDGVETAWDRLTGDPSFVIEEGLLIDILNVAGQWGRPELVQKALSTLATLGIQAGARHVAPVVQALALAGRHKTLFTMIPQLRSSSFKLDLVMLDPLVESLDTAEAINQGLQDLSDIRAERKAVDPLAYHAVLKAAAKSGDLQRMRSVQAAASDIGVRFTIDMYNTMLAACENLRHHELGDIILSDIAASKLAFDAGTYRIMINICLQPRNYESAFYYLEKMKGDHFKPPYETYRGILRKCFEHGDQRWTIVLEELESMGYRLDRETLAAIRAAQKESGRSF